MCKHHCRIVYCVVVFICTYRHGLCSIPCRGYELQCRLIYRDLRTRWCSYSNCHFSSWLRGQHHGIGLVVSLRHVQFKWRHYYPAYVVISKMHSCCALFTRADPIRQSAKAKSYCLAIVIDIIIYSRDLKTLFYLITTKYHTFRHPRIVGFCSAIIQRHRQWDLHLVLGHTVQLHKHTHIAPFDHLIAARCKRHYYIWHDYGVSTRTIARCRWCVRQRNYIADRHYHIIRCHAVVVTTARHSMGEDCSIIYCICVLPCADCYRLHITPI